MSDEGGVNVGLICGIVYDREEAPVEALVQLLSIVSSAGPESYWSKTGGTVSGVYSNKQGEYAIPFYWDATSPLMLEAHFSIRAVHKHENSLGRAHGFLNYKLNMTALAEEVFEEYMWGSALRSVKVAEFLKYARNSLDTLKDRTSSVVYTPELYAAFSVIDVHLE